MGGFAYASFISYKHPPATAAKRGVRHYWIEFIECFQERLAAYLSIDLPLYRDPQLDMEPGAPYPRELAEALCRSACMVAILVPDYLESDWCLSEWRAMESLEARRLGPGKAGLIIPVIFRGEPEELRQIYGTRQRVDLRCVQRPAVDLNTKSSRRQLETIATRISKLVKSLDDPCEYCATFEIMRVQEAMQVRDPSPFAV
jgi:TIR domain